MTHALQKSASDSDSDNNPQIEGGRRIASCLDCRYVLVLLGFVGSAIACTIQNNLPLAIVPMTERGPVSGSHTKDSKNTSSSLKFCHKEDLQTEEGYPFQELLTNILRSYYDEFIPSQGHHLKEASLSWTEKEQGLILGSFFWGYILTQYSGGRLAHKYGGKWLFSVGITLSGLLCFILPLTTERFGIIGLIVIRVLQGLAQGVTCPAIHVMLARWSPPEERSRMTNLVYTGYPFGTAAMLICGGYLIRYSGWQALFYVTGALNIVWFILWTLFVFDSPSEHPRISRRELAKLEHFRIGHNNSSQKNLPTPWKKILKSVPVWAIFVAQIGQFWGKNIIHVEIPKYLSAVHGLKIQNIGWIAAIPHFLNCIFGMLTSYISDILITKKITSISFTRKVCALIVGIGTSLAFVGIGIGGCKTFLALSCLLLGGIVSGATRGSWVTSSIDIAPNHAGTIMAIGNIVSYILTMVTPLMTGLLLHSYPGLLGWQIVFGIGAAFNFSSGMFFAKFAEGEEQDWSKADEDNNNQYRQINSLG